jgi:hypothetical protein
VTAAARLAIALAIATVAFLPGTDTLRAAPVGTGTIVTVAGTGVDGHDGDGGPATAAAIDHPRGIAALPGGGFVFAEPFANTVRRVGPDGTITTIAGSGTAGFSGDGGPATHAEFRGVHGVGLLPDGGFVLADPGNQRIRRIWPDASITTVAGTGEPGDSGDSGPAVAAEIDAPRGVAALKDGGFLFPDTENDRIRRVWPDGRITTVAGTGVQGFSGDGGPAAAAQLNWPFGVAPAADGGFLIVDRGNQRIRRVSPSGTITTVAGTGVRGFSGDGGRATAASVNEPHAAAALPDGGFLIADTFNDRVRRVWPDGRITTVAGTGVPGFSGDGGPAALAELTLPKALAILPDASGFLLGDAGNNRVRLVRVNLRPPLELRVTTPRIRSKAGRPATLRYSVSDAATARLVVSRGGKLVMRVTAHASTGSNTLVFGRSLRFGSYSLRLAATTLDGRLDGATASLRVVR